MPPLRFAPYRQIAVEIADRLAGGRSGVDPLSPWPEEVIVPSRGVAEAISAALVERFPEGVAGLRMHTIEELSERTLVTRGSFARVAADAERRLAMRMAVRTIDDRMMESRGIAAMLERAHRDVRDSGLTLGDFSRRSGAARGLRNAARTGTIARAWAEYERLVSALSAVDRADRLNEAVRAIDASVPPQLLAGFYDMTGAQWRVVEALLRAGRIAAVWIPSEAPFAAPLIRALTGLTEVVRDPSVATPRPRLTTTSHDTRTAELRYVCRRIGDLLRGGMPASMIGIVGRSLQPYDVRLLNRFAAAEGFRTPRSEEMPLVTHRIGRAAVSLLQLRENGFPRAEVLELVRDGLNVRTRIHADAADAATRRARIAGGTSDSLAALRGRTYALDDYISLVTELEELTRSIDTALLTALPSMFRVHRESDRLALDKLEEIAATFRRADVWKRGLDAASVVDAIEQESIPLDAGSTEQPLPRIWAGDVMRFRGRSFEHLFVIRMQDDVFPQRRNEDPLIPDSDRRLLGMREIGDGSDEEALLFSLLADSARSAVSFSFATGDGFGKVLRPSRFLRGIETTATRPEPDAVARPARERALQLLARAGSAGAFDGYVGAAVRERLQVVSPTQLEDFGECPQKFLLKHILGVTDVDEPERELQINPRDKGTLDHRILERFYRGLTREDLAAAIAALPALPPELTDRLESIVDEQFEELERDVPSFNRAVRGIERRATKRILRDFVAADVADLGAQGLTPRWFEYRFGTKHRHEADHPHPFVIEAAGVPVRVEGTIDRIDTDFTRYRIVDYKSGKAGRHLNLGEKVDRGVRLQLALYAMAVSEFFELDPSLVSATIKPLVNGGEKGEKFAFALHEKRDALLQTLEVFVRAILDGAFPAFPDDEGGCRYCPVNHSCRTRHDPEERAAVLRHGDARTLLERRRR